MRWAFQLVAVSSNLEIALTLAEQMVLRTLAGPAGCIMAIELNPANPVEFNWHVSNIPLFDVIVLSQLDCRTWDTKTLEFCLGVTKIRLP